MDVLRNNKKTFLTSGRVTVKEKDTRQRRNVHGRASRKEFASYTHQTLRITWTDNDDSKN